MKTLKLLILNSVALVAGMCVLSSCGKTPAEEAPEPEVLVEGEVLVNGSTVSTIESCFYGGSMPPDPVTEEWHLEAFEKWYDDYRSAAKDTHHKLWYQSLTLDDRKKRSEKVVLLDVAGYNSLSVSLDNGDLVLGTGVASVETFDVTPSISQNKQHIAMTLSLTTDDGKIVEVRLSGIALFDGRW